MSYFEIGLYRCFLSFLSVNIPFSLLSLNIQISHHLHCSYLFFLRYKYHISSTNLKLFNYSLFLLISIVNHSSCIILLPKSSEIITTKGIFLVFSFQPILKYFYVTNLYPVWFSFFAL